MIEYFCSSKKVLHHNKKKLYTMTTQDMTLLKNFLSDDGAVTLEFRLIPTVAMVVRMIPPVCRIQSLQQ